MVDAADGFAGPLGDEAMRGLARTMRHKRVLVTGGSGFLGRHIVELLLACGARVRVFDLVVNKFSDEVEFITGNLTVLSDIEKACEDCWAVIHAASPNPLSKNWKLFYAVNVDGTKNVVAACRSAGVRRLVYTSSSSVVFDGTDQYGLDETAPPSKLLEPYAKSKLMAEEVALRAADAELAVCAMRPHSIFGPRDPHFVPNLLRAGRSGRSRYIIGSGANVVDFTYVGNVAYAHVLALVHLTPESKLSGQAYFITNADPVSFWDLISEIQAHYGFTRPWLKLPYPLMYAIAFLLSFVTKLVPSFQPLFNMQTVTLAGCHHWYKSDLARRHFGYVPPVSLEEAKRRNFAYFDALEAKNFGRVNGYDSGSRAKKSRGGGGGILKPLLGMFVGLLLVFLLILVMPEIAKKLFPGLVFSETPYKFR